MGLLELSESDKEEYNNFIKNSLQGSFLQSWEWGEWQNFLGRQIFRYWILDDIGSPVASIQLIKIPLPFGKYYVYAPYGPVEAENYESGIKNYEWLTEELKNKFPDCVFFRIEPKTNQFIDSSSHGFIKSLNIQPGSTFVIDLSKSEDELLAQMHPKTRYNIRLAKKHGIKVKQEFGVTVGKGLLVKEAMEMIVDTQVRQGYHGRSLEYYRKMVDFFSLRNSSLDLKLHVYKASLGQELLASAIILDFGSVRTYLFGGSSESQKEKMAPYALHFQAIRDAKAQGFTYYDFWGGKTSSGQTAGFARFKAGFGGRQTDYAGAWDAPVNKFFYFVYRFARKLAR